MISENKDYKHYDYLNRKGDPYAAVKYRIIARWLPATDNLAVLNAGCGSGEMNELLSRNPTWRVDAIDPDAEAVELSRNSATAKARKNLSVTRTDIENYDTFGKFDVIVCNDVLEHIKNDAAVIEKLSSLLKGGGMLILSVPALKFLYGYHDEMLGHYRRYDKNELVEKLSKHLRVEACRYFGFSMIPVALLYSRVLRMGYPVQKGGKGSIIGKAAKIVLAAEAGFSVPAGTSLLAVAVKE